MKNIAKIGLAAALLFGGSSIASAEDAAPQMGVNAGANTTVDATTTGSLGKNYGSVISSLQSNATVDLSAFNDATTVNCVSLTSMQGNAANNAAALDNAISRNQSKVTMLQTSLEANVALWEGLHASCTGIVEGEFGFNNVIAVEAGVDGSLTFYVDDRLS